MRLPWKGRTNAGLEECALRHKANELSAASGACSQERCVTNLWATLWTLGFGAVLPVREVSKLFAFFLLFLKDTVRHFSSNFSITRHTNTQKLLVNKIVWYQICTCNIANKRKQIMAKTLKLMCTNTGRHINFYSQVKKRVEREWLTSHLPSGDDC